MLYRKSPFSSPPGALAVAAIAMAVLLSSPGRSWAYIDPNAGGFLAQILAPLASIFISFLFYCRKEIKRLARSVREKLKQLSSRQRTREARD